MTVDDSPDIDLTDPHVFPIAILFAILFGGMIGAGIFWTFANLSIPPDKGIAVVIILMITSGIIGSVPHLYNQYTSKTGLFEKREEE
jgi:high-affinity Fe2+/Pb2+ permease